MKVWLLLATSLARAACAATVSPDLPPRWSTAISAFSQAGAGSVEARQTISRMLGDLAQVDLSDPATRIAMQPVIYQVQAGARVLQDDYLWLEAHSPSMDSERVQHKLQDQAARWAVFSSLSAMLAARERLEFKANRAAYLAHLTDERRAVAGALIKKEVARWASYRLNRPTDRPADPMIESARAPARQSSHASVLETRHEILDIAAIFCFVLLAAAVAWGYVGKVEGAGTT